MCTIRARSSWQKSIVNDVLLIITIIILIRMLVFLMFRRASRVKAMTNCKVFVLYIIGIVLMGPLRGALLSTFNCLQVCMGPRIAFPIILHPQRSALIVSQSIPCTGTVLWCIQILILVHNPDHHHPTIIIRRHQRIAELWKVLVYIVDLKLVYYS